MCVGVGVRYTVTVGPAKTPKVLLRDVSGCCQPNQLIALMGATGGAYLSVWGAELVSLLACARGTLPAVRG